ncbi:hypothetical protein [Labilibaculum euxinus]
MSTPLLITAFIIFCVVMIIRKTKSQKINEPKADPFEIMQIGTRGVQLLESLSIISTTRKLDTLSGRIEYILEFYPSFVALGMFPNQYMKEAQKARSEYEKRYPNRPINNKALYLLLTPDMDNMGEYIASCIVISYSEFIKDEMEHVEKLKRNSAINKRIENIIKLGDDFKSLFETHNLPDTGQFEAIDKMKELFNKKAAV